MTPLCDLSHCALSGVSLVCDKRCLSWPGLQWMRPPSHSGQMAACHVRGIKWFNHASLWDGLKKRADGNRLNMFESGNICILCCRCQSEMSQMFLDSVCSLCSHVISFLTLCPWPAARSGFWFTITMAESGEGRDREGERANHWHTILCQVQKSKQKTRVRVPNVTPAFEGNLGSSCLLPCYAEAVSDT